jgi:hypothetical protein
MFAFAPMGIWGVLRKFVETIWYLHLVAYLSLRMRWTALPAAYGNRKCHIHRRVHPYFSRVDDHPKARPPLAVRVLIFSIPLAFKAAIMAALYGVATVFLFRMTRKLIFTRAGEN